jgi:hypothetical protein
MTVASQFGKHGRPVDEVRAIRDDIERRVTELAQELG